MVKKSVVKEIDRVMKDIWKQLFGRGYCGSGIICSWCFYDCKEKINSGLEEPLKWALQVFWLS
jgi:hypothetical protein